MRSPAAGVKVKVAAFGLKEKDGAFGFSFVSTSSGVTKGITIASR
jgi:hypothetical protein